MNEKGFVYVGFDSSGLFKIGITRDLKKRMRQYKTTNPNFQYLCDMETHNPALVEAELHAKFGLLRKHGEWFDLTASDLQWIHKKFYGKEQDLEKYEIFIFSIKNEGFANFISNPENIEDLKIAGFNTAFLETWR